MATHQIGNRVTILQFIYWRILLVQDAIRYLLLQSLRKHLFLACPGFYLAINPFFLGFLFCSPKVPKVHIFTKIFVFFTIWNEIWQKGEFLNSKYHQTEKKIQIYNNIPNLTTYHIKNTPKSYF